MARPRALTRSCFCALTNRSLPASSRRQCFLTSHSVIRELRKRKRRRPIALRSPRPPRGRPPIAPPKRPAMHPAPAVASDAAAAPAPRRPARAYRHSSPSATPKRTPIALRGERRHGSRSGLITVPISSKDIARPPAGRNGRSCQPRPIARTDTPALPFCHLTLKGRKPPPYGYPTEPKSLGEHMKKRRMDLGLTQREVARRIGANPWTVANWEKGKTNPASRFLPEIDGF